MFCCGAIETSIINMIKKISKNLIFLLHIVVAASPFVLICYLFKTWVDNGEVTYIPFVSGLYWVGIDPSIKNIYPSMLGYYKLYIYILKLPLLLWLFIIAIPSFKKLYESAKD
jgi:hypothetical protein